MRVKRSSRGLGVLLASVVVLASCATSRPTSTIIQKEIADYTRSVVARGHRLSGGLAVLSSPQGDVLFVANGSEIDEIDGETGQRRSRHTAPFSDVDNLARDGRHVLVLSATNDRVAVLDPDTDGVLENFGGYAGPVNALRYDNSLLVAELDRGSISRQAEDGGEADTFVTGMRAPAGLTGSSKNLWVADRSSGTVLQLVANGQRLAEPVEVAAGLAQPEGLAVTSAGSLIVAETGTGRLLRIEPQARKISVIDEQVAFDAAPGSGRNPIGTFASVAIGACGTIYVSADATGEIIRYVPVGTVVCQYGQ